MAPSRWATPCISATIWAGCAGLRFKRHHQFEPLSCPRKRASISDGAIAVAWIPTCAGMTLKSLLIHPKSRTQRDITLIDLRNAGAAQEFQRAHNVGLEDLQCPL